MKVAEALELIRRVGVVESAGGSLKLKFPETERATLQPAIDTLRSSKAEAMEILAKVLNECGPPNGEPLEAVLKNRAIELWSTVAGRMFLVADEDDARLAMERVGALRGEIYTAAEMRRIVMVNDPVSVAEIHEWKRRFGGIVRDVAFAFSEGGRGGPRASGPP